LGSFNLALCQPSHSKPLPKPTLNLADLKQISPETTSSSAKFSLDILAEVRKTTPGNVVISPYSVSAALLLALNGAHGSTADALRHGLGSLPISRIDRDNKIFANTLSTDEIPDSDYNEDNKRGIWVDMANGLWVQQSFPLNKAYVALSQDQFGAHVENVDFATPSAAGRINAWVSNKTHKLIPILVTPADVAGSSVVLTNAVYFHGKWSAPFEESQTKVQPFIEINGEQNKVPMMFEEDNMGYAETPVYQLAEIPYGYRRWNFLIVLPKSGHSIDDALTDLGTQGFSSAARSCKDSLVDLSLPKFNIAGTYDLGAVLNKLGMGVAFSSYADFTGIGPGGLQISRVLQKTVLDVDEKGTSAAAATAIMVTCSALPPDTVPIVPKVMKVDHPFFFAIQDAETGMVLMEGVIEKP